MLDDHPVGFRQRARMAVPVFRHTVTFAIFGQRADDHAFGGVTVPSRVLQDADFTRVAVAGGLERR